MKLTEDILMLNNYIHDTFVGPIYYGLNKRVMIEHNAYITPDYFQVCCNDIDGNIIASLRVSTVEKFNSFMDLCDMGEYKLQLPNIPMY